ncbi:MAG: imidazole glycerol phosphate synthase subunit HisF, partial [Deltaproteobacteria bacterium]|nr:imidazole glycerol phosphate synthase subunit HisF [Deltaproteobacteria bacterium]
MLTKRIIPCLDVFEGRVVKGVNFRNLTDIGDPVELARFYNDEGADEIVFLDVGASYKSKNLMLDVVNAVSQVVFIPISVGGGIRTVDDIRNALLAGADKVSFCTAALERPELISESASIFGSQCIVLSVDAKKEGNSYFAYKYGGRENSGRDVIEWVKFAESSGAGEILLNSIDRDGTREGYDILLLKKVAESVSIPVIASGGAGKPDQICEAFSDGNADAALVASIVHTKEFRIRDIKMFLKERGINVRPVSYTHL